MRHESERLRDPFSPRHLTIGGERGTARSRDPLHRRQPARHPEPVRGEHLGPRHGSEQRRMRLVLEQFLATHRIQDRDLSPEVARIVRCIHQRLFDPNTCVKTVKLRCGIRSHSIASRFRHAMGTGIREHIEILRLHAATHLLRLDGLEIFAIARAVGYAHEETFYRAFRRRYQTTPATYRELLADRTDPKG